MVLLALAAGALAWTTALIATPVLPAPMAGTIYAFCALICHQLPERSFHAAGAQLPVCARCFGIYAGAAAGLMTALPVRAVRRSQTRSRSPRAEVDPRILITLGAIPTLVTVAFEWARLGSTSNSVRAATGAVLGAALAWALARETRRGVPAIN